MEPERLESTVLAAFLALIPIVTTVLLITLASRAADGRLPRNSWVGIRGPSTMRSDRAWVAGHRAALRLTPLYLVVAGLMLTGLFVAVLWASTAIVKLVGLAGVAIFLVLLLYTAFMAAKAARLANDDPDGQQQQCGSGP